MSPPPHPDWLVPDWPAPPGVKALCTTRAGGVSKGPYESLNLGNHVGDEPQAVAINRERFAATLSAHAVFLQQVHGTRVLELQSGAPDGAEADACWTTQPGLACTIMVADCLPVLFAAPQGRAVAAAHAGWRGLAQGVLEATWERIWPATGVDRAEAATKIIVWLGPCIGPSAFEVGAEVKAAFESADPASSGHFRAHREGKWMADLSALARQRLHALGITRVYGNDGSDAWCTVTQRSRFFSHRRDGVSGRFAASIWLG